MHIEMIREYCLAMKNVEETFPFDEHTIVFKVMGKMFALVGLNDDPLRINLKCDPERALQLRDEFEEIMPGYHMSKVHWNTIVLHGRITWPLLRSLIDHSYELIVASLPKKLKDSF